VGRSHPPPTKKGGSGCSRVGPVTKIHTGLLRERRRGSHPKTLKKGKEAYYQTTPMAGTKMPWDLRSTAPRDSQEWIVRWPKQKKRIIELDTPSWGVRTATSGLARRSLSKANEIRSNDELQRKGGGGGFLERRIEKSGIKRPGKGGVPTRKATENCTCTALRGVPCRGWGKMKDIIAEPL